MPPKRTPAKTTSTRSGSVKNSGKKRGPAGSPDKAGKRSASRKKRRSSLSGIGEAPGPTKDEKEESSDEDVPDDVINLLHLQLERCASGRRRLLELKDRITPVAANFSAYSTTLLNALNVGRDVPMRSWRDFMHEDWKQIVTRFHAGATVGEVNKAFTAVYNNILLDVSRVTELCYLDLANLSDELIEAVYAIPVVSYAEDDEEELKRKIKGRVVLEPIEAFRSGIVEAAKRLEETTNDIRVRTDDFKKLRESRKGQSATRDELRGLKKFKQKVKSLKDRIEKTLQPSLTGMAQEEYMRNWHEIRYGMSYLFLEGTKMGELQMDTQRLHEEFLRFRKDMESTLYDEDG